MQKRISQAGPQMDSHALVQIYTFVYHELHNNIHKTPKIASTAVKRQPASAHLAVTVPAADKEAEVAIAHDAVIYFKSCGQKKHCTWLSENVALSLVTAFRSTCLQIHSKPNVVLEPPEQHNT